MKNVFNLDFDKTVTMLAGYDYGYEVYNSQIKGKIDVYTNFTIIFPDQIKRVASSFSQGFFKEIAEKIGIVGIEERLIIISAKEDLKEQIVADLL